MLWSSSAVAEAESVPPSTGDDMALSSDVCELILSRLEAVLNRNDLGLSSNLSQSEHLNIYMIQITFAEIPCMEISHMKRDSSRNKSKK